MELLSSWRQYSLYGIEAKAHVCFVQLQPPLETTNNGAEEPQLSELPMMVLGNRELEEWAQQGLHAGRRLDWLMGRIAVKNAVLSCLALSEKQPALSGVQILNGPNGSPCLAAPQELVGKLRISIAHTNGIAVGAAAVTEGAGIGIDIEMVQRYKEVPFPAMAFSDSEISTLQDMTAGTVDSQLLTRIWTAKEAAGKSMQMGLGQILKYCRFAAINNDHSVVTVCIEKHSQLINVSTMRTGELLIALAATECSAVIT